MILSPHIKPEIAINNVSKIKPTLKLSANIQSITELLEDPFSKIHEEQQSTQTVLKNQKSNDTISQDKKSVIKLDEIFHFPVKIQSMKSMGSELNSHSNVDTNPIMS